MTAACSNANADNSQCNKSASINNTQTEEEVIIFTPDEADKILFVLVVCFIPAFAVCGITGNIFSICVLVRDGLDKSYNVMLVSLACSDSSFLVPLVLNGLHGAFGFVYPYNKLSATFMFYKVLLVFDYGGALVSFTLPVLITFERIVVVFFPLTLARFVTPRNTGYAIGAVFVSVYSLIVYATVEDAIATTGPAREGNETVGGILILANFRNSIDSRPVLKNMSQIIFGPIPVSFVFTGCVLLAIKIKLQSVQRRKMTSATNSSSATNRVTLMLLIICFVYTISSLEQYFLFSGAAKQYYTQRDSNRMFFVFLVEVNNVIVVFNCSINFLVYVFVNQKFRSTFFDMMRSVCKK